MKKIVKVLRITGYTLKGWNNCFSMEGENKEDYRIVNFYHEILEKLLKKGLKFPISIRILKGHTAVIQDFRIANEYYRDDYCTVCCPEDLLTEPQRFEIERDLESGRRTEIEAEIGGEPLKLIKYKVEAKTHKLKAKYTVGDSIIMGNYEDMSKGLIKKLNVNNLENKGKKS